MLVVTRGDWCHPYIQSLIPDYGIQAHTAFLQPCLSLAKYFHLVGTIAELSKSYTIVQTLTWYKAFPCLGTTQNSMF